MPAWRIAAVASCYMTLTDNSGTISVGHIARFCLGQPSNQPLLDREVHRRGKAAKEA